MHITAGIETSPEKISVEFALDADYEIVDNEAAMITQLKILIAQQIGVDISEITNMELKRGRILFISLQCKKYSISTK